MNRLTRAAVLGCLLTLAGSVYAEAQTSAETAAANAKIRLGPLGLTPRFFLRDIGVDTNVGNSAENPEQDFTFTTGPGADAWLRVGRLWLTSESAVEWLYYRKTADQRAFNVKQNVTLELDLLRLVPHVGAGYERARSQLNFELDGRLEETTTHVSAGLEFKPGARTSLDLQVEQRTLEYGDEVQNGVGLSSQLSRETQQAGLELRYEVTPLTTFAFDAAVVQDRFEFNTLRDSDSLRIMPGFEFQPLALISGSARVGFKRFTARDEAVPDFAGVITAVDVAYTVRDTVQFTVRSTRDIEYSIEVLQPYYVSNTLEFEIVRVLGIDWDVVLNAGRTTLDYQAAGNAVLLGRADRTDEVYRYSAGLGRHLGEDLRAGITVLYAERRSDLPGREYSGWRTGGSLTYGF